MFACVYFRGFFNKNVFAGTCTNYRALTDVISKATFITTIFAGINFRGMTMSMKKAKVNLP